MNVSTKQRKAFQQLVWNYFSRHRRSMPWRTTSDPYRIFVSEVMLQQTQVSRVIPKFDDFINRFPDFPSLADAPLQAVLQQWQGLGYNRRARYLKQAAQQAVEQGWHQVGSFPTDPHVLASLPGIGVNTAAAIIVYSSNLPLVFIETNIRSVFLHHFFADKVDISDRELFEYIDQTLDRSRPREWYWALMDYGSFLKSRHTNPGRRSRHYVKQSPFVGSNRQLRGEIIRRLNSGPKRLTELEQLIADERLQAVIIGLEKDGLVERHGDLIGIASR